MCLTVQFIVYVHFTYVSHCVKCVDVRITIYLVSIQYIIDIDI